MHSEVYEIFRMMFPKIADNTQTWFPNGKHSVRIRTKNGEEFIFTYDSKNDWVLETSKRYVRRIKQKEGR